MSTRFIAYLDVLGFKSLTKNNSHEEVVRIYQDVFSKKVIKSLAFKDEIISEKNGKKIKQINYESILSNSLIASDSVIIWTSDNKVGSLLSLLTATRLLLRSSFFSGLPLRGAIVPGELSLIHRSFPSQKENSLHSLVGAGLVDAFELEGKQNWSGCIIDKKCFEKEFLNSESGLQTSPEKLIEARILVEYEVPMKNGKIESQYSIDWISGFKTRLAEKFIRNRFKKYYKDKDDWSVEMKIRNTLHFIQTQSKNHEK